MVRRLPSGSELLVVVPNVSALIFECVGLAIFVVFLRSRGCRSVISGSCRSPWSCSSSCSSAIGFLLAATYVFFRDLMQIIGFLLSIVFYLSPILYSGRRPVREVLLLESAHPAARFVPQRIAGLSVT